VVELEPDYKAVYFLKFSSVGAGNNSGVNLVAFGIDPFIFILPVMKAFYGFKVPIQTPSKSFSVMVNLASAVGAASNLTEP